MLKKDHILYLYDKVSCKIASDKRILERKLLTVCVVERHAPKNDKI